MSQAKIQRVIDGSKMSPWYDPNIVIFDRPVKQRFRCECRDRVCTIEIEDTEEIKRVPLTCCYCGEQLEDVSFVRVDPLVCVCEDGSISMPARGERR